MDYVYAIRFKDPDDVSCVYLDRHHAEDVCEMFNIEHWDEMQTPEEYRIRRYAPYYVVRIPTYS